MRMWPIRFEIRDLIKFWNFELMNQSVPGHQSCEALLVDILVDDEFNVQVPPQTPCPRQRVELFGDQAHDGKLLVVEVRQDVGDPNLIREATEQYL